MHKAIAVGALAIALPTGAQQQTVTCASSGSSQSCPADTRNGVLLVREQSSNVCRQGQTWSFDRRGINVNGGCSADFLVNPRGGGYGNNGYGNGGSGNGYGSGGDVGGGGRGNAGQGGRVVIPQGTQVAFRIDQQVRLADLQQNDTVTGTLANDLVANGRTVAAAGSPVQAKVMSAAGATLDLRLESINVNGTTYPLQSNAVHGVRDAVSTPNSSGGGGLGGVLSSLAGAGTLPAGTVFNFRLTSAARAQ